jgi:hypothetical protein
MQIIRGSQDTLVENHLPDGSRFIVDQKNETVYALNATAGVVWDACSKPTTLCDVTKDLQRSFGSEVTEELARQTVVELAERKLLTLSMSAQQTSRREALKTLGKVALPLVVAMTLSEQKAHAMTARSAAPLPAPPHMRSPEPIFPVRSHSGGFFQWLFGRE